MLCMSLLYVRMYMSVGMYGMSVKHVMRVCTYACCVCMYVVYVCMYVCNVCNICMLYMVCALFVFCMYILYGMYVCCMYDCMYLCWEGTHRTYVCMCLCIYA